jgi:hypothetical protein
MRISAGAETPTDGKIKALIVVAGAEKPAPLDPFWIAFMLKNTMTNRIDPPSILRMISSNFNQ